MKKISIPYQFENGKIQTQPLQWLQTCPCCGELAQDNFFNLDCRVDLSRLFPGQPIYKNSERFYSLIWRIPYCSHCYKHARISEIIKSAVILAGFFIFILSILYLAQTGQFIWYPLPIVILMVSGLIFFKIIIPFILKSRVKETCSSRDFAVHAGCKKEQVILRFDNDNYAGVFAGLNNLEMK